MRERRSWGGEDIPGATTMARLRRSPRASGLRVGWRIAGFSSDRVLAVAWRPPEHEDLIAVVDELRRAQESARTAGCSTSRSSGPRSLPQGTVRDALVGFYRDILVVLRLDARGASRATSSR